MIGLPASFPQVFLYNRPKTCSYILIAADGSRCKRRESRLRPFLLMHHRETSLPALLFGHLLFDLGTSLSLLSCHQCPSEDLVHLKLSYNTPLAWIIVSPI